MIDWINYFRIFLYISAIFYIYFQVIDFTTFALKQLWLIVASVFIYLGVYWILNVFTHLFASVGRHIASGWMMDVVFFFSSKHTLGNIAKIDYIFLPWNEFIMMKPIANNNNNRLLIPILWVLLLIMYMGEIITHKGG